MLKEVMENIKTNEEFNNSEFQNEYDNVADAIYELEEKVSSLGNKKIIKNVDKLVKQIEFMAREFKLYH